MANAMKLRTERRKTSSKASPVSNKIAIVGGGIAGLYCLYQLSRLNKEATRNGHNHEVTLFESAENVGGRISTHRIYKDLKAEESNTPRMKLLKDLEFYLEYGPMRLELDQQILLMQLLTTFGIKQIKEVSDQETSIESNEPFLVEFAEYKSESLRREDVYHTYGAERDQKNGLDLLRLALVRIFLAIEIPPASLGAEARLCAESVNRLRKELVPDKKYEWEFLITQISFFAEHKRWREKLDKWIATLSERDYQNFREFAKLDGVFLYEMGFWNLLSDLMSHNAVSTLSELGTFTTFSQRTQTRLNGSSSGCAI